jgi:hypothetical protein
MDRSRGKLTLGGSRDAHILAGHAGLAETNVKLRWATLAGLQGPDQAFHAIAQ